jgi:putative hydrolase of the HAD superfamily
MTDPIQSPAFPSDFSHVTNWIFDLDNTLYPHEIDLFAQIDHNMTGFVADLLKLTREEARVIQKQYYHQHGTTLKGLMINHEIDPADFLSCAHNIDYSVLQPNNGLADLIKSLPGRKFIFTNGSVKHAEDAAQALGISDIFDDIFDIVAADYLPKPAHETYRRFTERNGIDGASAAMFEDLPRNLTAPKALGMKTVLLVPKNAPDVIMERWEIPAQSDEHIDYISDDLGGFLSKLRF